MLFFSEIIEAAVKRLIHYSQVSARGYANGRLLNLTFKDGEGKGRDVHDVPSAQGVIRQMVETLATSFEQIKHGHGKS